MLLSIRRKGTLPPAGTVTGDLADCHERIRRFSELAEKLVTTSGVPDQEISEVAARVLRYFTEALPLHEDDEERSIAPRLVLGVDGDEIAATLDRMREEHRQVHALLDELVPIWALAVPEPRALVERAPAMRPRTSALRSLLTRHLAMEEQALFPAVDRLADDVLTDIRREMQARRAARDGTSA